jgi:hypothetical protein
MRRLLPLLVTLAVLPFAGLAESRPAPLVTYNGTATGLDGKFRYGPVKVQRRGTRVTFVEIKAISATCAGTSLLRTIVFRPASRSQRIVSGSTLISRAVMKVTFLPDKTTPENKVILKITFSGRNATGQFNESGLCYDVGKFTARR